MIMNDIMVMKRLPMSVIAHSGILSKNPQSSTALIIVFGRVVLLTPPMPDDFMIVLIIP